MSTYRAAGRHIYRTQSPDDERVGTMKTPALAERVAALLAMYPRLTRSPGKPCPTTAGRCLCHDRTDCRVPAEETP